MIAFFVCLVIGAIGLDGVLYVDADKTVKERQVPLYDAIMMSMVSIPFWHLLLWRFLSC